MSYRLLIVDDEPIVRNGLMSFEWGKYGFEAVHACENGRAALEWLTCNRADLVLTDIKMPGINGVELSGKIQELYPDTLVVLLTGYSDFKFAQQAIRTGVFDYLLKPAEDSDIENMLVKARQALQEIGEKQKLPNLNEVSGLLRKMIVAANRIQGMQPRVMTDALKEILMNIKNAQLHEQQQKQLISFLLSAIETELAKHPMFPFEDWLEAKERFTEINMQAEFYFEPDALYALCESIHDVTRKNSIVKETAKLDEALQYIHENYGSVLSLDIIADLLDMHPNTFSKWFKDHKGINFLDYVTRYRIDRSKQLLENTDLKAGDIAVRVGFSDVRYFGQVFKKLVEVTPTEYRSLFKQN